MKTYRLAGSMNELLSLCLMGLLFLGLLLLASPQEGLAAAAPQTPQHRQTPDPYFNPTTPAATPTPRSTRSVSWDAPLTPVKAEPPKDTAPVPFLAPVPSNDFTNRAPNSIPSNSIITERDRTSGDLARPNLGNDFLPPANQLKESQFDNLMIPDPVLPLAQTADLPDADSNEFKSFQSGQVLALVGGEPIFVGDMLFEINELIEKFMADAPDDVKDLERNKMIPQILPKFVESKLLFMGTLSMLPEGVDVDKVFEQAAQEFDDKALAQMIEQSGLKSPMEFDAKLRKQGSSLRQLRRSWSQEQLTRYFLGQQLNVQSEVTHQEMLDNYHANIASYAMPAKCRWEQIMVRFDKYPTRKTAKDAIVELGNQIIYGANLTAVAKKSSHGYRADTGGQHDWTTKDALVMKEIDDAIFSTPIGDLSEIIESSDGYHIIRVLERTEAKNTPFLEAQVDIKQNIMGEKRKKSFDDHLAKLKDEIPVEYLVNEDLTPPSVAVHSDPTTSRK